MNNATKLFEKFKNFREDIIFDLTKITKKHNNLINLDSSKEFEYVGEESNVFNVRYLKLIINSHGNLCVEIESSLVDEGYYEDDVPRKGKHNRWGQGKRPASNGLDKGCHRIRHEHATGIRENRLIPI